MTEPVPVENKDRSFLRLAMALAAIAIVMCLINLFFIRQIYKAEAAQRVTCIVDIWKLSEAKLNDLSQSYKGSKDSKETNEKIKTDIDKFMADTIEDFRHPLKYGCGIIAVKGSLLTFDKDITDEVSRSIGAKAK